MRTLDSLRQAITRWHDRKAMMDEIEAMDADTLREIASELGLSVNEFRETVSMSEGADTLMTQMMAAYGLAVDDLRERMPGVMRDVEIICSRCGAKGRCARELAGGTAAAHADRFCPNAPTFEALS
jgi:hypothetical protein